MLALNAVGGSQRVDCDELLVSYLQGLEPQPESLQQSIRADPERPPAAPGLTWLSLPTFPTTELTSDLPCVHTPSHKWTQKCLIRIYLPTTLFPRQTRIFLRLPRCPYANPVLRAGW